MASVLVTDARRGAAVSVIRSLHRAGHHVTAADSTRLSPGRWSRAASSRVLYPDPLSDPNAMASVLADTVHHNHIDIVIPVTEPSVAAIQRAGSRFPAECHLAIAPKHQLDAVRHKETTIELARQVGVPVPASRRVESCAEAVAVALEIGWPIVIKPEASVAASGDGQLSKFEVDYASTLDELTRKVAGFEGRTPVLLQEYCAGDGIGVELLASEGRVIAAFSHRRLREVPISGGASSYRESIALDPDLLRHSMALIERIGWTGLAMVEFKVGPNGARLMEINGRLWGSLPLAVRAGMDFPARLVEMIEHGPPVGDPPLARDYRVGVRSRNVELEVVWIGGVLRKRSRGGRDGELPSRRAAMRAMARLAWPGDGYDIASLRDPAPGVAEAIRIAIKLGGKFANG